MSEPTPIAYYFRSGEVERGACYQWRDGFSRLSDDGLETQPWVTRREAYAEAKKQGAKARFFDTLTQARVAQKAGSQ